METEKELRETTDFFMDNDFQELGEFYDRTELRTRVVVLDQDDKEVHDAHEAARHLADRHDLRLAFSGDSDVMQSFDKEFQFLSRNLKETGAFEAMVVVNHNQQRIQHGLHHHHNQNQEQSIKEFINRESVSAMDDLNADTLLTLSMLTEPLYLAFVDLELWDEIDNLEKAEM